MPMLKSHRKFMIVVLQLYSYSSEKIMFFEIFNSGYTDLHDEFNLEDVQTPVGSIIVMPGCTFYGYSGFHYDLSVHQRKGPLILADANAFESSNTVCGHQ